MFLVQRWFAAARKKRKKDNEIHIIKSPCKFIFLQGHFD